MATQGRGEATYRKILAEGREKGWNMREIARRSGIPYWTLVGWKRRLRDDLPAVLPVTVVDVGPVSSAPDDSSDRAVLLLRGGRRLLLPPLSPDEIAQFVRALETPEC